MNGDTRPTAAEGSELDMDGMLHIVGGCCCKPHDRRHHCGAVLHTQGSYGGLMEVCERCDIGDFMPAGTYEHDTGTITGERTPRK